MVRRDPRGEGDAGMKDRPILFSAPMVRAILAGTKTQTRRAVKSTGMYAIDASIHGEEVARRELAALATRCPYGQAGDQLWVREAFSGPHCMDASDGCKAVPPSKWGDCSRIWYWADGNPTEGDWTRPRPSIHMPRWASRVLLEITGVRVERLLEISEADAQAEGVERVVAGVGWRRYCDPDSEEVGVPPCGDARRSFRSLWKFINGDESWNANPWVWVVEFKRVQP